MPTIKQDHVNELYAYITGIIKNKNSHLYRINGVENHLHILTDMHPSIASADFMREVKASSSLWMKRVCCFHHSLDGKKDTVLLPALIRISADLLNILKPKRNIIKK